MGDLPGTPGGTKRARLDDSHRDTPQPDLLGDLVWMISEFSTEPYRVQAAIDDVRVVFDTLNRLAATIGEEGGDLSAFYSLSRQPFVSKLMTLTPLANPALEDYLKAMLNRTIPNEATDPAMLAQIAATQLDILNAEKQTAASTLELTRVLSGVKAQLSHMSGSNTSWGDSTPDNSNQINEILGIVRKLPKNSNGNSGLTEKAGTPTNQKKRKNDEEDLAVPKKKKKVEKPTVMNHILSIEDWAKHTIKEHLDPGVFATTYQKAVTSIKQHTADDLKLFFGISMNISGNVVLSVSPKMANDFTQWTIKLLMKYINERVPGGAAVKGTTRVMAWSKLVITGVMAWNSLGMTQDRANLLLSLKTNCSFTGLLPEILLGLKWLTENPAMSVRPSFLIGFEDPEGKIREKVLKMKDACMDFTRIHVSVYNPKPTLRQCDKCCHFGHSTFTCQSDLVCPYCSSDQHDATTHTASCSCSNCQNDGADPSACTCPTCPLCHSAHNTFFRECSKREAAQAKLAKRTIDKDGFIEVGSSNGKRKPPATATRNNQRASGSKDKGKGKEAVTADSFASLNSFPAAFFPDNDFETGGDQPPSRGQSPGEMAQ